MSKLDFLFRGEPLQLDTTVRSRLPGTFTTLPAGVVHYELAGPDDGQTVVLIHGFSTPCFIWDATSAALASAGFRVLRYDVFGRGYSDRPDTSYNMDLFLRQLLGLLDTLGLQKPVDLVGLSMGGAIAVAFTARNPLRVRRLCLLGPAGLPLKTPLLARLIQAPLLGELIFGAFGGRFLLANQAGDFCRVPADFAAFQARYARQMPYRGFRRALLSTVRCDAISDRAAEFAVVGRQPRPKLLVMGEHDRTVPLETGVRIQELMPGINFHAVPRAGHLPHFERPEIVNPLLIQFLSA
jgi:pimeloyl-ACP methyl ester carboxylesterase